MRSPVAKTYQKSAFPKFSPPLPKPVALTVSPKTYPSDWWSLGTTMRMMTMMATPSMCQYAETVFRSDVMRTLRRLRTSAIASTIAYIR
jgi:hypothetical protein